MVNANPAARPKMQQKRIIHFLRSNECNRYIRSMRIRFVVSGEMYQKNPGTVDRSPGF
jgi:hypothetical protein